MSENIIQDISLEPSWFGMAMASTFTFFIGNFAIDKISWPEMNQ